MQMFIPSVLSALEALLKGPTWLLWKVISIFFNRKESPPPPIPSSDLRSISDSPYESTYSQQQKSHSQHQKSYSLPHSQYEPTHSQQQGPHHSYPPPARPAAESSQPPSAHQSPSQQSPYKPHRQPSERSSTQPTSFVPPDVARVTEPVSHIPQRSRFPEPARTPDVAVTPIVIDPNEGHKSLRSKARYEKDQKVECFRQRNEANFRNDLQLAEEFSRKGCVHEENMIRLDEAASAKIFEENNQKSKPNTVDLHGLYVREALVYFDKAVQEAQNRGESSLRVIVGKGNHSEDNTPKIKPVIRNRAARLGLRVRVESHNDGCLVVRLNRS